MPLFRPTVTAEATSTGGGLTQLAADLRYAGIAHNHALQYAALGHDHAGVYALANHNHAGVYSLANHDHAGVYAPAAHSHAQADVTGLVAALAGKAASAHSHAIADVTGLQTALDGKAPAGASAPWTLVKATADLAKINTNAFANDTALNFAVTLGTCYAVRGMIWIDTTAAGDWKYNLVGPAMTIVRIWRMDSVPATAVVSRAPDVAMLAASGQVITGTTTNGAVLSFEMMFIPSANGTVAFQHAQNAATNDTGAIRRRGSYLEYATF